MTRRYEIIPSEAQFMCVPAAILTAMLQRGIVCSISQKDMAVAFGYIEGVGTQIQKPEYDPNKVFASFGIPLKFEYVPISKIPSVAEFVRITNEIMGSGDDAIICHLVRGYGGHVSLLESVDDKIIRHACSSHGGRRIEQPTPYLFDCMVDHGDRNMAGIWVLRG